MTATSSILFVTLGSLNQIDGGLPEYRLPDSIKSKLSASASQALIETRAKAYTWLKNDKAARWKGIRIADHKNNRNLVCGPDFGGDDANAFYLPALDRFEGRFFQTLGHEGKDAMQQSQHHILFICGLYGLSTLLEPIQLYNCPVEIDLKNFGLWTDQDTLTNALLDYIQEHQITRVFDFTATESRRRLISWATMRSKLLRNVFHCFSPTAAGVDALIPFAKLMKHFLLSASQEELMHIRPDMEREDVIFRSVDKPRSGMPSEDEEFLQKIEDEIDRKRRGIIRFLDKAEGTHGSHGESTGARTDRLLRIRAIEPEEFDSIHRIANLRNDVIYRQQQLDEGQLHHIEKDWSYLKHRVQKRDWKIHEFA